MKIKLIMCLAVLSCVLLTGCQTTRSPVFEYRASLVNLHGNGQTETNFTEEESGGNYHGRTKEVFSLSGTNRWLICFYPPGKPNETNRWQTDSRQAYAWLVRAPINQSSNPGIFASIKGPSVPPFSNSEPLHGTIEAARCDDRHHDRRYFSADLAGDDGVVLKAEMNTYLNSKTEFEPALIWIIPVMIFGGPFVRE
jgi:hypothetical protein